jgi:hypothetical protein
MSTEKFKAANLEPGAFWRKVRGYAPPQAKAASFRFPHPLSSPRPLKHTGMRHFVFLPEA